MAGKRGRPTDSRKEIRITVRIDARVAEALDAYCKKWAVTRAEAIRRAILRLLCGYGAGMHAKQ